MNNKILIGGAALLAFYMFSTMNKTGEKKYYVPGTGYVPESQLASLGYVNVGGQWYSQSQVNAAAGQAGVSAGNVQPGTAAWTAIQNILLGTIPLATTIINTTTNTNSGGDGGMGGIYGTKKGKKVVYNCSDAGLMLQTKHQSQAGHDLALCRWGKNR